MSSEQLQCKHLHISLRINLFPPRYIYLFNDDESKRLWPLCEYLGPCHTRRRESLSRFNVLYPIKILLKGTERPAPGKRGGFQINQIHPEEEEEEEEMICRKWSLLTGPTAILGGVVATVVVANFIIVQNVIHRLSSQPPNHPPPPVFCFFPQFRFAASLNCYQLYRANFALGMLWWHLHFWSDLFPWCCGVEKMESSEMPVHRDRL